MILWVGIAGAKCVNHGNRVIERSVEVLTGASDFTYHSLWNLAHFAVPDDLSGVLIPGCTTLGEPALQQFFQRLPENVPAYVLGGCFWDKYHRRRLGPNPDVLARPNIHIGSRDPYTITVLGERGIVTPLVGCPTVRYNPNPALETPSFPLVISFGRQTLPDDFWGNARSKYGDWSTWGVLLHEGVDKNHLPPEFPGTILRLFDMDPDAVFKVYQKAGQVISGRLHGVLPSAGRVPTLYYGDRRDTRNTLLDALGINYGPPEWVLGESPTLQTPKEMPEFQPFLEEMREGLGLT